jgi:N-methylhydantoinase B/oxoprolinase/acetone carboxylase alpha subunit
MFGFHDPLFLLMCEYKRDSAGTDESRGGRDIETEFKIYANDAPVAVYGNDFLEEAFSLIGGMPGSLRARCKC